MSPVGAEPAVFPTRSNLLTYIFQDIFRLFLNTCDIFYYHFEVRAQNVTFQNIYNQHYSFRGYLLILMKL